MKINQTRVRKSDTQVRLLIIIIAVSALIFLIPGSVRATIRIVKHQRVLLIVETSAYRNLYDDLSTDIYMSQSDESSSDDSENDNEEDDDWEA